MRRTSLQRRLELPPAGGRPVRRDDGPGGRPDPGHPAPRRGHRHRAVTGRRARDGLLPGGCLGVPPDPRAGRRRAGDDDPRLRRRLPRRRGHGERLGRRPPDLGLHRVPRPPRPPPARGRQRDQGRVQGPPGLALVLGGRHPPRRLAPRGRPRAPRARVPHRRHPGGRRRRRGGDRDHRGGQPRGHDRGRPRPGRAARRRRDRGGRGHGAGHGVPGRRGVGPATPPRGRPGPLGARGPEPLLVPGDPRGRGRGRRRRPHHLRDPHAGPRRPPRVARQRRAGAAAGGLCPPRQRAHRGRHDRPGRGAAGGAAEGGGLQRHPQRPQPPQPGDARRL